MVLSTDMAMHFELLDKFTRELASKPHVKDWKDRNLMLQMILHLADLANPSRPFHLARRWAEMVVNEFLKQVRRSVSRLIRAIQVRKEYQIDTWIQQRNGS